jgi:hypothetical protein
MYYYLFWIVIRNKSASMHIHFIFKESNNIYTYYMRQFKLHINSYFLGNIKEKELIFCLSAQKNDTIEKCMSIYEIRWRKFATGILIAKVINRRILQRHRYSLKIWWISDQFKRYKYTLGHPLGTNVIEHLILRFTGFVCLNYGPSFLYYVEYGDSVACISCS